MKRKLVTGLLVFAILLSGCEKEQKTSKTPESKEGRWQMQWERLLGNIVPYQNGFYYMGIPSCLSYYDIESEESVVLCDKNGCGHGDEKCFAYIDEMPDIYGDKLYYISSEGEVSIANADNTQKKQEFSLLAELKKEEKVIFLSEFLMADRYLYFKVNVTDYTETGEQNEEERIYVMDLESREEILITVNEDEHQSLALYSAQNDVLYYTSNEDKTWQYGDWDAMTEEDWKEAERLYKETVFRAEAGKEPEPVLEIENGSLAAVTDEYGIYYTEYAGKGHMTNRRLLHKKDGEEEAEVVFETEDSEDFSIGARNADYLEISSGKKHDIYDLNTMKPVEMKWEYALQASYAWPVPGGFAVPEKQPADSEERNYAGEAWKYLGKE